MRANRAWFRNSGTARHLPSEYAFFLINTRLLIDDVMAYKERIDAEREAVLAQLTAEAQGNEMGYRSR